MAAAPKIERGRTRFYLMWSAISRIGRPPLASALIIFSAILLGYIPSFSVPFLFDDQSALLNNPSLENLADALRPDSTSTLGGRPLASVSFALNHALHGENVVGYHVVNFGIHIATAFLLFAVLIQTRIDGRVSPTSTRDEVDTTTGFALAATLLWACHPALTEAVTYISQRAESLMGLCYLGTLYTAIRANGSSHPHRWLLASVAICALGMLTKESMVTAPVIVLFYNWVFVATTSNEVWRRRWYYVALACTWLLLGFSLGHDLPARKVGFGLGVTSWEYALTESCGILLYLKLVFAPHPLVFDYGPAFEAP